MPPTVTVIVPAHNAATTLGDCLTAIAALGPAEIIVFDDASTDATAAIAAAGAARVITADGGPHGPAYGRNVAAATAEMDQLLFVDADVVVAPDALARLAAALAEHGVVAAFGSYDDRPASQRGASLYANLRHHYFHQRGKAEAKTFWSGLGLIDRSAFFAAGGFDAARFRHPSIEDIDLGGRLIAAGHRIRLVPEAQGQHRKDWRVWRVWHTDVARRAWPWAMLIATDPATADGGLNLSFIERTCALAAFVALAAMAAAAFDPRWLPAAAAATLGYVVLNGRFFGFLAGRITPTALLQAVAMHFCYHLYGSTTYIAGRATAARRVTRRTSRIPSIRRETSVNERQISKPG